MRAALTIPFFRILIPFLAGIAAGIGLEWSAPHWLLLPALLALIAFFNFYSAKKRAFAGLLLADLFLVVCGWNLVQLNRAASRDSFYGNLVSAGEEQSFIAVIDELPVKKQKFVKCSMKLLELKRDSSYEQVSGAIIAYVRRSAADTALAAGRVLLVKAKLSDLQEPKNPYEFDYKAYLQRRQIHHTAFVDSLAYACLPVESGLNPLWQAGLSCKRYLLETLKRSPLTETSYAICAALLTGYDDDIERPVMESFSHSGTLHVLSVSGLHTGLIYLALGFLIDLADRRKKYKVLRFCFISGVLWCFALITGFCPPVLRAVLMFNLLGLGNIFFRNDYRNQLNILCVSAFVLLGYNPFFVADIGFLLSYFALFGLIYFQPKLSAIWQPGNGVLRSAWQSITASVAATVSTLPLTLFYFKQFPIWFFVCNLVVVPATFAILLLALLVVLKINLAAVVINYLVAGLVWFINLFNSEGYGFIDRIDFGLADALYLSLLIVLVSLAVQFRSYRQAMAAALLLICWQLHALEVSLEAKQKLLFSVYHSGHEQVLSVKNRTGVTLTAVTPANYNYHIKPHITSFNNANLSLAGFNYVSCGSEAVLVLSHKDSLPATHLREVTTLVLGHNFRLREADLAGFEKLSTIVADGSNNTYTIKKTQELSRKFGLGFYSTASRGAYLLALQE